MRKNLVVGVVALTLLVPLGMGAEGGLAPPGKTAELRLADLPPGQPPAGLGVLDPWVDARGDNMTGDLGFASGRGIAFPGGRLLGASQFTYGTRAVCLAGLATSGCGDITGVAAGSGLSGGGSSGDVTLSVNTVLTQARVAGSCAAGSAIRVISETGLVTCEVDDGAIYTGASPVSVSGTTIGLSTSGCTPGEAWRWTGSAWSCDLAGDVTSVTAGPGLSGGGSAGDLALSLKSAGSSELGGVLSRACGYASVLTGIGSDGAPTCSAEGAWRSPTLPRTGASVQVGSSAMDFASMTIGPSGFPVIAARSVAARDLVLIECEDWYCTTNRLREFSTPNDQGEYASVAVGSTGLVHIAYYDATNADLMFKSCSPTACTTTALASTGDIGRHASLAILPDGTPFVAFQDTTNEDLWAVKCSTPTCSGTTTRTLVDSSANNLGAYTSTAIGPDGLPYISYHDGTLGALKFARCQTATCSSRTVATAADFAIGILGVYTSMAFGADGSPVIAHFELANGMLWVTRCSARNCLDGEITNRIVAFGSSGTEGEYPSIVIGPDGLPVVSFYQRFSGALRVVKCLSADCLFNVGTTVDATSAGRYSSMAIGVDGLPVIVSSDDDGTPGLQLNYLSNPYGLERWWRRG